MSKRTIFGSLAGGVAVLALALVAAPAHAAEVPASPVAVVASATPDSQPSISELQAKAKANAGEVSALRVAYPHCDDRIAYGSSFVYVPFVYASSNMNCILEVGNNNRGVSTLQQALNSCYGKGLVVDGAFGNATYNALLQVQSSLGVTVDGVYGPGTRHAMKFSSYYGGCYTGASIGL